MRALAPRAALAEIDPSRQIAHSWAFPSGPELVTALGAAREEREQQTIPRRWSLEKNTKGCVISKRHRAQRLARSSDPHADDLRDWRIIGAVVITSSLLVWGSILALHGGT